MTSSRVKFRSTFHIDHEEQKLIVHPQGNIGKEGPKRIEKFHGKVKLIFKNCRGVAVVL